MTCANCHSPKGPPAAVAGKDFSGGLRFDEPPFDVTAPNITPDKETGIGNWTDAQIKTVLLTGKNPHGVQSPRSCRRRSIRSSRPAISNAIVAYLRSLHAGEEQGAGPDLQDRAAASRLPGRREGLCAGRPQRQAEAGFYLVTIGHCMECHTPFAPRGGPDFKNSLGKGGREFPGPWGVSKSRNITSQQDRRHRRLDRRRDQDRDHPGQAQGRHAAQGRRWAIQYYAKMTDADLDAVIAYRADGAGEGIAPLSAPAGAAGAGDGGPRALQLPPRGAYISVPSTGIVRHACIASSLLLPRSPSR